MKEDIERDASVVAKSQTAICLEFCLDYFSNIYSKTFKQRINFFFNKLRVLFYV